MHRTTEETNARSESGTMMVETVPSGTVVELQPTDEPDWVKELNAAEGGQKWVPVVLPSEVRCWLPESLIEEVGE